MNIKTICEYPDDNDGRVDFGYLKNNIIAKLPEDYTKVQICKREYEIAPQDVVDMKYDSFVQKTHTLMPCKYFDSIACAQFSSGAIKEFLQKSKLTDRFQENNILLSNAVWNNVLKIKKRSDCMGYFQRLIDKNREQVNFSTLESLKTPSGSFASTMNTIQFKFDDIFGGNARDIAKDTYEKFKDMFEKKSISMSINAINDLAGLVYGFSIHKYYLPNGPEHLEDACLLVRYDACAQKHKNGTLPPLYRGVYPQEVCEPHFHFTRGFGSLYKLTNKMTKDEFGVGYAIGITDLKKYIDKLNNQDFANQKEKNLYMENDFGMPFLRLYLKNHRTTKIISSVLATMRLCNELWEPQLHLTAAYDVVQACAGNTRFDNYFTGGIKFKNPYLHDDDNICR